MNAKQNRAGKSGGIPLSTLLSHLLVAFTIEFDNEFEHRTPHVTTTGGVGATGFGVWLTSMVMYSNTVRLVSDAGVSVGELERLARTPSLQLAGLKRWGYIQVAPDANDKRPKPPEREWIVRLTVRGQMAKQIWAGLFDEIEQRWQKRFGEDEISGLRRALAAIVAGLEIALPEYLPIVGYGLGTTVNPEAALRAELKNDPPVGKLSLPALLAKTLLGFTLEFERESKVSLPVCANVLRVLEGEPVKIGDLPRSAGVSIESVRMATGFLKARGYARIETDPEAGRGKAIRLTPKGQLACEFYLRKVDEIEDEWKTRFGKEEIEDLRSALESIAKSPLLMSGIEPYPDGWRAKRRRPETLPHHPMVLHRGGYPDGS